MNALIHRDYLINGSEVHIDIFDDRMTIYSPGGMPDGTLIQNLDINDIPSTRRNLVLADIFNQGYNDTIKENEILNAFLDAIKENPKVSQRKFSELTGYSKRRVQTTVEMLVSEGTIERVGGTRGYWKIKGSSKLSGVSPSILGTIAGERLIIRN